MVLTVFCFVEKVQLVLVQYIGFFLTGLTVLGSLGVGKDFIHVFQLPLQLRVFLLQGFYRLA